MTATQRGISEIDPREAVPSSKRAVSRENDGAGHNAGAEFADTIPVVCDKAVNVASVPQRSPLRYPGGKTWLVPQIRKFLESLDFRPEVFVEPFAGGGIASLTAVMERVEGRTALGRLDDFAYPAGFGVYTERYFPSGVVNALSYRGETELNGLPAVRYERRDLYAEREGLRDGLTVGEFASTNPLVSRLTHYTLRHDGERMVDGASALTAIRAVDCP